MGCSVYCLCDAVLLVDPGSIGIGMATTMRSCKERASMVLLCDMHVGVYSSPLKRGLPPPGARSAALPRPGLLVRCGIAGHRAAPIRAYSAEIEISWGERYISTFQSFRAITTKYNCSTTEQSIHSKER